MRFKVRSLGGKLIIVAALTLLLCMIFFSALSWGLLKYLSEHEARSDATLHLSYLKKAYQAESVTLIQDLNQVARSSDLISTLSQPTSVQSKQHLEDVLARVPAHYHVFLVTLDVVAKDHHIVGQLEDIQPSTDSPAAAEVT